MRPISRRQCLNSDGTLFPPAPVLPGPARFLVGHAPVLARSARILAQPPRVLPRPDPVPTPPDPIWAPPVPVLPGPDGFPARPARVLARPDQAVPSKQRARRIMGKWMGDRLKIAPCGTLCRPGERRSKTRASRAGIRYANLSTGAPMPLVILSTAIF